MRLPLERLRGCIAPLVLILIGAHQFYRVQLSRWNSWRGGGFGMYAGFHPAHTDAWLWLEEGRPPVRVATHEDSQELDPRGITDCTVRANEGCLRDALQGTGHGTRVRRIQIWRLSFDPSTGLLRRDLLAELASEIER